jgi:hypothetical protein
LGNARLQGLPGDVLGGDKTGELFDWVNSAFFFTYVRVFLVWPKGLFYLLPTDSLSSSSNCNIQTLSPSPMDSFSRHWLGLVLYPYGAKAGGSYAPSSSDYFCSQRGLALADWWPAVLCSALLKPLLDPPFRYISVTVFPFILLLTSYVWLKSLLLHQNGNGTSSEHHLSCQLYVLIQFDRWRIGLALLLSQVPLEVLLHLGCNMPTLQCRIGESCSL